MRWGRDAKPKAVIWVRKVKEGQSAGDPLSINPGNLHILAINNIYIIKNNMSIYIHTCFHSQFEKNILDMET